MASSEATWTSGCSYRAAPSSKLIPLNNKPSERAARPTTTGRRCHENPESADPGPGVIYFVYIRPTQRGRRRLSRLIGRDSAPAGRLFALRAASGTFARPRGTPRNDSTSKQVARPKANLFWAPPSELIVFPPGPASRPAEIAARCQTGPPRAR